MIVTQADLRPLRIAAGERQCLVASSPAVAKKAHAPSLTARQIEVLREVAEGQQNKEICQRLGITRKTLEMHIANAMATLNARNRVAAAVTAVRLGLI